MEHTHQTVPEAAPTGDERMREMTSRSCEAGEGAVAKQQDRSQVEEGGREERVNRMGTGSISRLLTEFAIPAIIGMLVNSAYNLIDALFLGRAMGEVGLSATQVAMPIMTVYLAIAMLVGAGGNALAALRLGAGKRDEAERVLGNTVTLSIILSVAVAIAAAIPAVLDWAVTVSGSSEEVRPYAASFLRIISFGFILQCIGFGVNNFIRTAGAPNRALLTMVIGAVVCTVFNYLFVMVLGWGIEGSAAATLIGQGASCVSVLWYFLFTQGVPLKLRLFRMRPVGSIIKSILALGTASFAVQVGAAVLSFATNFLLVKYGAASPIGETAALASVGLVQRVAMLTVMPLIGVAIAAQPILGFNYGAKLFGRVRRTLLFAILMATSISVFMWALVHLFPSQIVGLFGITDEGMVAFTVFALQVQLAMLPVVGFQVVGANYFQATGQPVKSTILTLSRQVIFLLPLMFILPEWLPGWTSFTGLDAIYIATPVSDVMAIIVTFVFVLIELRSLKRVETERAGKVGRASRVAGVATGACGAAGVRGLAPSTKEDA